MNKPVLRRSSLRRAVPWVHGALAAAGLCIVFSLPRTTFLPPLLWVCLSLLFCHAPDAAGEDLRFRRCIDVLAAFFSLCLLAAAYETVGLTREASASLSAAALTALRTVAVACGGFLLFRCLLHWLFAALLPVQPDLTRDLSPRAVRRVFLLAAGLLLLCYLPAFYAEFPGVLSRDSIRQMEQVMGIDPLSNRHSLLHTVLIKGCYLLGQALFHSVTGGIAVYSAAQLVCVALVLGYTVSVLYRLCAPRWMVGSLLAFFGLLVCNGWLAVTMWKDVPFTMVLLLLTCRLLLMTRSGEPTVRDWILFVLLGVLGCLFRLFFLAAFALLTPFLLFSFRGRQRGRAAICCGTVLLSAYLSLGPLMRGMQAAQPDTIEALSIPAQQIARLFYEQSPLDEADLALLNEVVDTDQLAEAYLPYHSTPIKTLVRAHGTQSLLRERAGDYLRLYLRLGCRYPGVYIRAFIEQTRGFYAPTVAVSPLGFGIEENSIGVPVNAPAPGSLRGLLHIAANALCSAPVYAGFFSIGLYTWLLLAGMALARRRAANPLPSLPALFTLMALLISTPLANAFRYGYFLLLVAPFLLFAYSVMPAPTGDPTPMKPAAQPQHGETIAD